MTNRKENHEESKLNSHFIKPGLGEVQIYSRQEGGSCVPLGTLLRQKLFVGNT
jgi:hypothetical protein